MASALDAGAVDAAPLEDAITDHRRDAYDGATLDLVLWLPASFTDKIDEIPDYAQTDPDYGGLPGGGAFYCAPVAVSNSLIWMDDHGYSDLVVDTADRKKDQFELIQLLGSSAHMATDLLEGTSSALLVIGLRKLLVNKGYDGLRLEHQGWNLVPLEFSTEQRKPDIQWIKQAILGAGSVWLNIGWYVRASDKEEYRRIGGHWVTVVGYGHDGQADNPDYLIVHDPVARAGLEFSHDHVRVERMTTSGDLVGDATDIGLPLPAAGYFQMSGDLAIPAVADLAILDNAVALRAEEP